MSRPRASRSAAGKEIIVHASCRIDLAGGTMDIWPLYLFHPGAVTVNAAINVLTRCRITPRADQQIILRSLDTRQTARFRNLAELCAARRPRHPLAAMLVRHFQPAHGFELETHSESPAGAGISGSSALMVATTAALARFTGVRLSREQIRVLAQDVEAQLIAVPTGCQDYYPALYGGVSAIELRPGGVERHAVPVSAEELDSRLVLVYTGAPRKSGINNWEVFKAHINGDRKVFRNFSEIARIACAMRDALTEHDWPSVARLLRQEWKLRRTNAPGISTPLIEKLMSAALRNGALAAKVCGAGGGGCVLFFVEPDAKARVTETLRQAGGAVLPCRINPEGFRLVTS